LGSQHIVSIKHRQGSRGADDGVLPTIPFNIPPRALPIRAGTFISSEGPMTCAPDSMTKTRLRQAPSLTGIQATSRCRCPTYSVHCRTARKSDTGRRLIACGCERCRHPLRLRPDEAIERQRHPIPRRVYTFVTDYKMRSPDPDHRVFLHSARPQPRSNPATQPRSSPNTLRRRPYRTILSR
jgi:hypothetical protein